MSNKLFLSLGDIIQIQAPTNPTIDNHIYLITYLDTEKIKLLQADKLGIPEEIEFAIHDGALSDETITEIAILNRPLERGFAQQHKLLPGTWINIYFNGDVPTIITGKIVTLEEDMIEIETYPEKKRLFIDFAYEGIPANLPIEKIMIRNAPISISLHIEDIDEAEGLDEQDVLQLALLEGEEIIFGDEETMTQIVDVPEEEKRYGIIQQSDDLLDELLAVIPTYKRTHKVLNSIHKIIERFKQLRSEYSIFDSYGNPEGPLFKGPNYKPLVETLQKLDQKLYWIIPIAKNRKKII